MPLLTRAQAALFADRRDAGRKLGARLHAFCDEEPLVIGLPRGGVPVAYEVAKALHAPLDVVLVRKLGAPLQPEYGIGAIGEEGVVFLNEGAVLALGLADEEITRIEAAEREELERRRRRYRGDSPPVPVAGRTVILVDDGIATGSSAIAAARVLRRRGAARVVLAVPVGPPRVGQRLAGDFDEVVCLAAPEDFFAVGLFYDEFGQTSDEEVEHLLRAAREQTAPALAGDDPPPRRASGGIDLTRLSRRQIEIPANGVRLPGDLRLPPSADGIVVFAHGSGSSRLSRRNIQVAAALNGSGFATLLFDLLTEEEALGRQNVFDIELLGERLRAATRWVRNEPDLEQLAIGYFGASTGAAAALVAAADLGNAVQAVVSRGGRPDLAEHRLAEVTAPTLLIVGGNDHLVIELNRKAAAMMRCPHELVIVPGATHLFEEPGALEQVCELASTWFDSLLPGPPP